jgi:hypothetical protein
MGEEEEKEKGTRNRRRMKEGEEECGRKGEVYGG